MKHSIRAMVGTLVIGMLPLSNLGAATFQAVEPAKSVVGFAYSQMGVKLDGHFKTFSAQVKLDTDEPAKAEGRIDIDLSSIDTGSAEADEEVAGKSWFDTAAHPRASFVLQRLGPAGAGRYEADGQLTIKGRTRELRAPIAISPDGVLTGSFVLRRADFGIGEGMWAAFDVVANEITVNFKLVLK